MVKFLDRREAGRKLGDLLLEKFPVIEKGIILSLPRGGSVVGFEIAQKLNLPHDIIVTRKIGAPFNPEYAIAAVSANKIVQSSLEEVNSQYLSEQVQKERLEIERRMKEYRGVRPLSILQEKTVILVDDGLATGLTMQVAIKEVKLQKPAKIILAVPVAPLSTIERLKSLVDKIVVLMVESEFWAVGQFYQNFDQVSDQEVKESLKNLSA